MIRYENAFDRSRDSNMYIAKGYFLSLLCLFLGLDSVLPDQDPGRSQPSRCDSRGRAHMAPTLNCPKSGEMPSSPPAPPPPVQRILSLHSDPQKSDHRHNVRSFIKTILYSLVAATARFRSNRSVCVVTTAELRRYACIYLTTRPP